MFFVCFFRNIFFVNKKRLSDRITDMKWSLVIVLLGGMFNAESSCFAQSDIRGATKTSREKLGEVLKAASEMDARLYKVQFVQDFLTARSSATLNYNNANMGDGQLQDTCRKLEDAMKVMEKSKLGKNLAIGASVAASSTHPEMGAVSFSGSHATDGNLKTRWASEKGTSFELLLDLKEEKEFNQIIYFDEPEYVGRIRTINVQVSSDNKSWVDWRVDAEPATAVCSMVAAPVSGRYIRLSIISSDQGANAAEIGVYSDPDAIETVCKTKPRLVDPAWIKPEPSEQPNVYQLRKAAMKYGMFIHYGVNTFTGREWGNGAEKPSDYNPAIETLDPDQWVKTAWEAGMNYIILITKHHDGFALFDTQYSDHKVTKCGHEGAEKDIVKAVSDACRKYGIKLGLYFSIWDMNWERNHPKNSYPDLRSWDQAYADFAYNQVEELMKGYGEICELWIDGGWVKERERWEYEHMYDMVKRLQPGCQMAVNVTMGQDPKPAALKGGEEIVNYPSDFKLFDGYDTRDDEDPKVFTWKGQKYYLPFEGTFRLGNGWFWNKKSSDATFNLSAEQIKHWYEKYVRQDNTLVVNLPPSDKGLLTPHEVARILETGRLIGIARGEARANASPDDCIVEVRHVTTEGNIAASTEYLYGKEKEIYETRPAPGMKEKLYILTAAPKSGKGVFSSEKIVVEYVYEDKTRSSR